MIIDACGICEHYENGGKTKINRTLAKDIDIKFPVIRYLDGSESTTESIFVTVIEVPGLAIIQRKSEKELGFYEKVMGSSVVNSWPIFAIFGAMTLVAGMVIWILVRQINISFGHWGRGGRNSHVKRMGSLLVVAPGGVCQKLNFAISKGTQTANVSRPLWVYFRLAFSKNNNSSSDSIMFLFYVDL